MELDELCTEILERLRGAPRTAVAAAAKLKSFAKSCLAPWFSFTKGDISSSEPAAIYWGWFERAMSVRLKAAASAKGNAAAGIALLLKDPSAEGICRTCREVFGRPLSEVEAAHLQEVPLSVDWLKKVLA
eukprot:TRINITY_DN111575_c0_g1_i1.p1 TRINITY_DN111575_c0_g1~~TRINITY_DN111575_c0_g1_i1.p1  ORF type:complete len:130 (+),score=28.65 TRINITY_DN111575_c0_g1_i1:53-442(+)